MRVIQSILLGVTTLTVAGVSVAGSSGRWSPSSNGRGRSFERIATLANYQNNASLESETVSEIVASTADGQTLVYTDGAREALGFIDISAPASPQPIGKLELLGEPTSVAVLGSELALVGVNTSSSLLTPEGHLAVVDIEHRVVLATMALGGQPDSVAISPDGRFAAVAIENERDEEVTVDGVEGGLPQQPAGFLAVVDIHGTSPADWGLRNVDLTGLASYGSSDPEPEFVDINRSNQAVVTLQENNHLVIVDLPSGAVRRSFTAGSVTLEGVDTLEDGVISLSDTLTCLPREPDAVTWIAGRRRGQPLLATANEGDLFGGSRGFSIFDPRGRVVFDSGSSFEELAVRHGHYPEGRSDSKGSEPESVEYARFGGVDYLFVGSERGSFVAVYELFRGRPKFVQLLPAPLAPEGVLAIPSRGLLVVSGEDDTPPFGVRSSLMVYRLERGAPSYPQIASADDDAGKPIAWSALSGMTAIPGEPDKLLAVSDAAFAQANLLRIDVSGAPAVIESSVPVVGGSGDFDAEGIAVAPDGTYWIASEGDASGARANRLVQTDAWGQVLQEVFLPPEIEACRAASSNSGSLGAGFAGVAVAPRSESKEGYGLLVAQSRGWDYTTPECESLDDDLLGRNEGEPTQTRIWHYEPDAERWSHFPYELAALPAQAGWVGLSEITRVRDGYLVVERDDRSGDFAELKTLVRFSARQLSLGISAADKQVYDLLPELKASHGWVTDKPEGVAVTASGRLYVVSDNDGVDGWSGETWFLRLGQHSERF